MIGLIEYRKRYSFYQLVAAYCYSEFCILLYKCSNKVFV